MNREKLFYTILDDSDIADSFENDQESLLKAFPHAAKKSPVALKNFYLARKALLKVGHDQFGLNQDFRNVIIVNHHYLANSPQKNVSLSHTDGCAAAVMSTLSDHRSIGIDLELVDRKIPKNSQKYFRTNKDSKDWSDLELWVLKEACFKCIQPLWKRLKLKSNLVLNDIAIEYEHFSFFDKLGEEHTGNFIIERVEHNGKAYIMAIASLFAESQTCV